MKEKIKSKVKKVVLPIFISVLSGGICGHLVYNIYEDEASRNLNTFQIQKSCKPL